jgi:hypothetical protein
VEKSAQSPELHLTLTSMVMSKPTLSKHLFLTTVFLFSLVVSTVLCEVNTADSTSFNHQKSAASTSATCTNESQPHITDDTTSSHQSTNIMSTSSTTSKSYEQDGDEARQIAKYLPYFPFKGIPRFYDIGGFLEKPDVFQQIVDIFVSRYREIGIDSIAG